MTTTPPPNVDTEKLAYDYTVWVAPELMAYLKKSLSFMEEHPYLFQEGEIERTKESITEFEELIANA